MSESLSDPKAGISTPGLIACASRIHARRLSGVFWMTPAPSVDRLPRCVRSGPTVPVAPGRSANRMARHARVLLKYLLARRASRRDRLRLLLCPGVELVGRIGHDRHAHPGVLRAAVLVARAVERARTNDRDPHGIRFARHQVLHPAELRHVEAVNHVNRVQTGLDGVPTGTCSSLAVMTCRLGYVNSHHH